MPPVPLQAGFLHISPCTILAFPPLDISMSVEVP